MSALNVSVLGAAREEYMEQLKLHLSPLVCDGFITLYEDAKRKEDEVSEYNGNYLKQFQKLMCDVPYWNQSIIEEITRNILQEVDYLMELVAAVFVSHVKILASVKLGGQNSQIRIKIPTSDIFVHAVYCKAAKMFYYNPYKFLDTNDRDNYENILGTIDKSINDTINSMIPIESILKEYLSNVFSNSVKDNPGGRMVEQVPMEQPGQLLDNKDLGLPEDVGSVSSTASPFNDNFGAGGGYANDEFPSDNLEVGGNNNPFGGEPFGQSNDIPFRDDETVFTSPPMKEEPSSGGDVNLDQLGSDPFAGSSSFAGGGDNADPFAGSGGGDNADPFAGGGGGDADPFAGDGGGENNNDLFKEEDIFKNDSVPTPPDLIEKPANEEINFFGDLP